MNFKEIRNQYLDNLKLEYNNLVLRLKKADKFFKNCNADEVDKNLNYLDDLINSMNEILLEIKRCSKNEITSEEIERGFNI